MNLALLAYELRAAGIKSIAIELSDETGELPEHDKERDTIVPDSFAPTEAVDVEPEFAGATQCAVEGCGEEPGGILGGKMAKFCRKHAFGKMGIK